MLSILMLKRAELCTYIVHLDLTKIQQHNTLCHGSMDDGAGPRTIGILLNPEGLDDPLALPSEAPQGSHLWC